MEFNYYQIEQYIQGELTGNELLKFETLLKKDEALRKKVNFYQYAESILTKEQTETDVEKLAKINPILEEMRDQYFINKTTKRDIRQTTKSKPTITRRLFPFAALAAAAALLIFFFLPGLHNKTNMEIAQHNFERYELSANPMGANPMDTNIETLSLYNEAKKKYNDGDFEEALERFTKFLQQNPKAPELWLAKGCAAFELDDLDTALESFNKVIEIDDGILHPIAHWYLALCSLKKEDSKKATKKAINYLKKIELGADNYDEAQQLLRQLE